MKRLIVIVGPTASGKTAAAIELAQKVNGEIICADSRTVYRGMDIGTAKPTAVERAQIPHHLLDLIDPDEHFTVADFKRLAVEAIDDIHARGKVPILVGGSGLYIDAILYDYKFADPDSPRDSINKRHLAQTVPRIRGSLRPQTLVLGLEVPREELRRRLEARVEDMISAGFLDEVTKLRQQFPNSRALLAPGYKAFIQYLDGHISLDDARALFVTNDYQLARRQMTWFRRNNSIQWLNNSSSVVGIVTTFLNKFD